MPSSCCSINQRQPWLYGLAALFATLGIILLFVWPHWAQSIVRNDLVLRIGSTAYDSWVAAPIPIYLIFYMFNWTNPEQVRNRQVKPFFVEMGPYIFLEKRLKENITFYNNDTVFYYQRKTWFFQSHLSNGSLDDMVTSGHAITAAVADDVRHSNIYFKKLINFILNHEGGKLNITKSVRDWLFNGFQDDLVDFLNLLNSTKINIPYKKFGWLVERNASLTYDGSFTAYTGVNDISKLGQLTHWNSNNISGYYPPPCGIVNGTTGDLFPPHLDSDTDITIFATDACRFINLQPNGAMEKYGLKVREWVGTNETLDSGENFPNQKCFCNPSFEECPKTGVVECKKCRNNAPIFASFPHFYLADHSYLNAVEGLDPNPEIHKFTLTVEPITGIPVEIHGRLQINMKMTSDTDFDIFNGINEFLMPLFWFDQTAHLSPQLLQKCKLAINLEDYGRNSAIILITLGCSLCLICIVLSLAKRWNGTPEENEPLLTN